MAKSIGDDVKIHKLERLVEENEYALKCSGEQMQQLMEECKRNKDTTNQLLNDVQQIQKLKNQLQEENSIITKENEVLKQQLQTFSTRTLETRDRSRAIVAEETNDITSAELNARLGGLDLDLTRVSEAIQQQGYDGQERCMSGMVKHLQDERQTVSDLRNKITERDQKVSIKIYRIGIYVQINNQDNFGICSIKIAMGCIQFKAIKLISLPPPYIASMGVTKYSK